MKEAWDTPESRGHKSGHRRNRRDLPADSSAHRTEPPDHHTEPSARPTEPTGLLADHLRRAGRVDELLAQHPEWNAEQIARHIGISAHTLGLAYKAATGITLRDALLENTLQHAVRLLRTTELSIKQIATACGYADGPSLTHAFKRRFGQSPRQYRRTMTQGLNGRHKTVRGKAPGKANKQKHRKPRSGEGH